MTTYERGDVVLAIFPHADLQTYSRRPALVVQAPGSVSDLPNKIIVQVTTNLERTGPTRVAVRKNSAAGRSMGILHDSVIVADNIRTVSETAIARKLGRCASMDRVDRALRRALGL